jgi:predicted CoA-substrate-specific enzyme activase
MTTAIGIDVGSAAVKVVALMDGRPAAWLEEPTRPAVGAQSRALVAEGRRRAGMDPEAVVPLCATGYGRNLLPDADLRASEIMANAAGAAWLADHWGELERLFGAPPAPDRVGGRFRTILDVGGQDSKVIVLDPDGLIRDFSMNDRCAAGTGRFLEVMARVLELDLAGLDELARRARRTAPITSACTVFAESEVVSLLAEGVAREEVAAGVFASVAASVAALPAGSAWQEPVLFDGGPSRSRALQAALAQRLGIQPAVAPCGQFATALGACLLAAGDVGRADSVSAVGRI